MNDTRIMNELVSLSNPRFALRALRSKANFGFGTLAVAPAREHAAA
jgi:hypothetical protein